MALPEGSTARHIDASGRIVWLAHAHRGDQSYLYLFLRGTAVDGRVHLPVAGIERAMDVDLPLVTEGRAPVGGDAKDIVVSYLEQHFSISAAGRPVALRYGSAIVRALASGPYLLIDFEAPDLHFNRPGQLVVEFDALIESISEHEVLLIAKESRGWGGLYRFVERTIELNNDRVTAPLHFADPTGAENLSASVSQGFRMVKGKARQLLGRRPGGQNDR